MMDAGVPVFVQQVVGVVVRTALVWLSAELFHHGIGEQYSDSQIAQATITLTPIVAATVWSVCAKYKARQKLLAAMALAAPTSEAALNGILAQSKAPSVFTPSNQAPVLTAK